MAQAPQLLHRDDRVAFYGLDDLFVAIWYDAPRATDMQAMAQHAEAFVREVGPVALVNIIAAGSPRFSDDVRRMAAQMTSDPKRFPVARAHVILMTGFAGVAVRAFTNTFMLLGRAPWPTRMHSSVEAAAQWLHPFIEGDRWTPETMASALNGLLDSSSPSS